MRGTPDVLATVDNTNQSTTAGSAFTFNATPLVTGNAITRTAGSTDVGAINPVSIKRHSIPQFLANAGDSFQRLLQFICSKEARRLQTRLPATPLLPPERSRRSPSMYHPG